jgi:hypothetical protein
MSDSNGNSYLVLQDAAYAALFDICMVAPLDVVKEQISQSRSRFRNVNRLDDLLHAITTEKLK